MLEHYEPMKFFYWFEKITQIPRPTFHEEKICDFLEGFAQSHGLTYYRDEANNILMRVPATTGYEHEPPMLLQSHMDMVAEQEDDVDFNFMKDPIRLVITGNELHAKGTTLGADDAGGMSVMLAIADSPELPHPELELLFTSQEEVGLTGIQKFDCSLIRSRRMINLDCGRMHNISVSSAGAMTCVVEETFQTAAADGVMLSIKLAGGIGGHAGLEIHKNRACAGNILGEILVEIGNAHTLRLVSLDTPRRPILGEMNASFIVEKAQADPVVRAVKATFAQIKKRYVHTDPAIHLEIMAEPCMHSKALSQDDSMRVAKLMYLLRTGAKKHDGENPSIILVSSVITAVTLADSNFRFDYTIRAVEDRDKQLHGGLLREILGLLNFSMRIEKSYPGWPKSPQSDMVALIDKVHERIFGYIPGHQYIHGGIEVGVIVGAIPEMDAVGMLPSMANAHTPQELLYLDQVPDYWQLITSVIAEKRAPVRG